MDNTATHKFSPPSLREKLHQYIVLTRLHRPIGIWLLMWPMLWALWWAAEGVPDLDVLVVFVLGAVMMRSAGCAINDFADRKLDPQVARTRARPLATGTVRPAEAIGIFVVLSLASLALVFTMNELTRWLAIGGVALAIIYPFSKRYTYLPQVVLGAAFGWAVPMAWAAQAGELTQMSWLVYIAAIVWAVIYDTIYAMVDRDDDIAAGARSTAILFGDADRLIIGILQMLLWLTLAMIGFNLGMGGWYFIALALGAALFDHHQWLIREREPQACLRAFLHNHWFGMVVFAGIALHYYFGG